MKIIIIGGNRFVGKLLAQQLSYLPNMSVTLINRTGTGPNNCILIKCDRNTEEFKQQLKNIKADIVIDMCLYNINQYDFIKPLLKQTNLKKYIFISSIASKIKSFGNYGVQKQLLEDKIKKSTLPYIILQPTYIIGKEDHSNRLSQYINNLITDNTLSIDNTGNKLINFVDAEDVCNVILKLINSSLVRKEYEIGCNEITSINDLIYRLSTIMNITPKLHFNAENSPYADTKCFAINFNIKRDINYSFINFNDTLKKICNSYENKS
tara:strand:- start:344 stop:1141 length:798 start_codon:yes stop_codon:yes gene_type:complete